MKRLPLFIFAAVFAGLLIAGCKEEQKVDVAHSLDPSKMPTMSTRNVSTLISDSGITQYKIVTPLWNIYDEAKEPYWDFPEGLYLQKYDPKYRVIATVAADSAIYYKNERLWRLEGEVEMTKVPQELFLSPRVFWDQKQQKIYSDTFIHIENATHVIEGTGFVSDEMLTSYRILKPNGIFPINRDNFNSPSPVQTPVRPTLTPVQPASPAVQPNEIAPETPVTAE